MNHTLKADPILCIGCRTCMIACVVNHTGRHIFEIDPDGYDFNPRIHIKKTATKTTAVFCHQCPKPRCAEACPFGVITIGEDRIVLDESQCRGCGLCAKACPFGAITVVDGTAYKCDLCASGETGQPACIPACPTEALSLLGGPIHVDRP